jgi:CheY-like chemotaxis protein
MSEQPQSRSARVTILVVDDDPAVAEVFARMLTLEGYKTLSALDAETGLQEAEAAHVDASLLDLRMAHVDALAFLRRLRAHENWRETPVAVIRADRLLDDATIRDLHGLDAATFFKPLWIEDLVHITQRLVRGSSATGVVGKGSVIERIWRTFLCLNRTMIFTRYLWTYSLLFAKKWVHSFRSKCVTGLNPALSHETVSNSYAH